MQTGSGKFFTLAASTFLLTMAAAFSQAVQTINYPWCVVQPGAVCLSQREGAGRYGGV